MNTSLHAFSQVTAQRDKAGLEQDGVVGKLTLLERERGKLIDELTTAERKLKEATKVCMTSRSSYLTYL